MSDGEVRLFGVSVERPGPGVIVDAIRIRRKTANTWLHWDRAMADDGLRTLAPVSSRSRTARTGNDPRYTMGSTKDLGSVLRSARSAARHGLRAVSPSDRA